MKRVNVLLPEHIKSFLSQSNVPVSTQLRNLAIEYYRKSRLSEVVPEGLFLNVSKIDVDTNTLTVDISREIQKALDTKIKRIAVKL